MTEHLKKLADTLAEQPDVTANDKITLLSDWKKTVGAERMFQWFSGTKDTSSISQAALELFIAEREAESGTAGFSALETEIADQLGYLKSTDRAGRMEADRRIQSLLHYLQARTKVVQSSQKGLRTFRTQTPEAAPILSGIYEKGKGLAGNLTESFMNAELKDKAVMLAGVYLSYLMIRGGWKKMFGDDKPHLAKDILGVLVGGAGIYLAAEAVNKSYKATTGVPLFEPQYLRTWPAAFKGGQSVEGRQKTLIGLEIEQALVQLKESNFPPELFSEYKDDEQQKKFVYALGNIGTLTLDQFAELYERGYDRKSLTTESPYPSRPFKDDKLTAAERFTVLQDVGKTLGILKDTPDAPLEDLKNWKEIKETSIIHLSMDKIL